MKACIITLLLTSASLFAQTKPKTIAPDVPKTESIKGVTMTVGQLIVLGNSATLSQILNEKFPAAFTFRLNHWWDTLKPEIMSASKARTDLLNDPKLFVKKADGSGWDPKPGAEPQKALDALTAEKVQIALVPLVLDDDLPGLKLSVADLDALGPLVTEKK